MPEPRPYSNDTRRETGPAPVAPGGVGPKMGNEEDFEKDFSQEKKSAVKEGEGGQQKRLQQQKTGRGSRKGRVAQRGLTRARAKTRQALRASRRQEQLEQSVSQTPKKKLTGWPFYVVLFLAIIKDIVDIIVTIFVISSIASTAAAALLTIVIVPYYLYSGVLPKTKKVVMWVITAVIAYVPFLAVLPTATINVVLTRIMTNNELFQAVASKVSVKGNIRRTARRKAQSAM
ncbi:MAG: hypothetical protein WDZ82_03355 [Candidatus Paceibacterota bacterium]